VSPTDSNRTQALNIAVVTDGGETVSRHFGRARFYLVATIANGEVVARELRAKAGHEDFAGRGHGSHEPGEPRGYGHDAPAKHRAMTDSIRDCDVLIAGGMGRGALGALQAIGIETVITDERDISVAVGRYVRGDLPSLNDRLH
jgi:predicted Fe-Mo cluster-binding NifX family protein